MKHIKKRAIHIDSSDGTDGKAREDAMDSSSTFCDSTFLQRNKKETANKTNWMEKQNGR